MNRDRQAEVQRRYRSKLRWAPSSKARNGTLWPMIHLDLFPVKVTPVYLPIVSGCFCVVASELNSCSKDCPVCCVLVSKLCLSLCDTH